MPVEFSVAAYRFGHSMVRNEYQTNLPFRGFGQFAPLFDGASRPLADDLSGFRPITRRNVVQWDWFLPMTSSGAPRFPQMARRIDTKLGNALAYLPGGSAKQHLNLLAYRNLRKGLAFGLPAARDMARQFGVPVLEPSGNIDPLDVTIWDSLWFYVLREAESMAGANAGKLGPLGSTIVCATFAGLLRGDPLSYFNVHPLWKPDDDPLLCPGQDNIDKQRKWTLASIIRIAGLPASDRDVRDQSLGAFASTLCTTPPKRKRRTGRKRRAVRSARPGKR
jgi:hypothetical protein